jgi:hypothetical protein
MAVHYSQAREKVWLLKSQAEALLTGCAWQVLAISSQEAPYSIANTASAMSSPAD